MKDLALYIHWPFCMSLCPYCDFNSHVRGAVEQEKWLNAYIKEIQHYKKILGNKNITSIFFGGGTPSLMDVKTVEGILNSISREFTVGKDVEISLEANPTSTEYNKFKALRKAGVNRLSLGIQSFNNDRLKFLGRKHSAENGMKAIEIASANYDNFSFDIIYNLPNQTNAELQKTLNIAFQFKSPHISLYQLTIEKGTKFFTEHRDGKFELPNESDSEDNYNFITNSLRGNGLNRYEVSNYAKEGFECKHNLSYWNYDEYLGIGAGAHSRVEVNGKRNAIFDIHNPEKWLENVKLKNHGIQNQKPQPNSELLS